MLGKEVGTHNMAPRNQGIMSIDPSLLERLIGPDRRKGLGQLIGENVRAFTDDEFFGVKGDPRFGEFATRGTKFDALKRDMARPLKVGADIVSNIPGFFKGISQFAGQESDDERLRRGTQFATETGGLELDLPSVGTPLLPGTAPGQTGALKMEDVPGMDIFTSEGQKALTDIINQAKPTVSETTDKESNKKDDDDFDSDLATSTGATDKVIKGADTPAKKAVVSSLSSILDNVRPGVDVQEYDDYIKEFGKVTGLDISGEPDTKQALMSFGLALMQNRAGKGFNISNILGSVGEAGEAALPEFSKAVSEAKSIRAKAGQFAFSRKREDEAAARDRKNYTIVAKGKGGLKGLAENIDKVETVPLNSFELNALIENKQFSDNFEIIPESRYQAVLTAALKTPELGKKYMSSKGELPLFEGAEGIFKVPVQFPDRNYTGPGAANKPAFLGDADAVETGFRQMRKDIDNGKAEFAELINEINNEGVNVFRQTGDYLTNLGAAFGVNFKDEQTSTGKIRLLLNRIQAKYAPQILGETGKTISDADRQRVAQIVGDLKFIQNPEDLKAAVQRVFKDIINNREQQLKQGVDRFNSLQNKKIKLNFGGGLNEEQQKKLQEYESKFLGTTA